MIFRPATPGFIVTLTATILLALVSFNVPLIKSISFLKATLSIGNVNGTMTIGTLGYCLELSTNGTTCSSASVGYKFDPSTLVGDLPLDIDIPNVVVKWITYALFIHVIAFAAAALAALFGLLAHVREMSMACCSTCISGLAAVITLIAFIFDIVLFFVVKKRVDDIDGSATFGTAVWMTLAAAILLFASVFMYACGRCMVARRPRGDSEFAPSKGTADTHAEQMRLEAVKAEADRKARQNGEVGLPAFPEHADVVKPLKDMEDDSSDVDEPYRDHHALGAMGGPRRQGSGNTTTTGSGQTYRGGYAQGAPGTRAVDDYYSPSSPARSNSGANMGYPPNRQYSTSPGAGAATTTAAAIGVGAAAGAGAAYLSADHARYPTGATYGHGNNGTSYHTAASQHQQYASGYSSYDPFQQQTSTSTPPPSMPGAHGAIGIATSTSPQPYADPYSNVTAAQQQHQQQSSYGDYDYAYGARDPYTYGTSSNTYGASTTAAAVGVAGGFATSGGSAYRTPTLQAQPERSYTLGGGGYGANVVPDVSSSTTTSGFGTGGATATTAYGAAALSSSPPPMPSTNLSSSSHGTGSYDDAPPGYEATGGPGGNTHVPAWGSKV